MKSFFDLIKETLDQRAIIDNREIVDVSDANPSVIIAFNHACEFMRDLHNWKWNTREDTFLNDPGQDTFPMPYGIVTGVLYQSGLDGAKCELGFVSELWAEKGCPSQWTHDWANEEIKIAPAASLDCDELSQTILRYNDRNIAYVDSRNDPGNLLQRFDPTIDTKTQFLNVPEYIYDAYARCVILKTRVLLNQNAQTTIFQAHNDEWNEAYNGLMSYAKTPFYTSERTEI